MNAKVSNADGMCHFYWSNKRSVTDFIGQNWSVFNLSLFLCGTRWYRSMYCLITWGVPFQPLLKHEPYWDLQHKVIFLPSLMLKLNKEDLNIWMLKKKKKPQSTEKTQKQPSSYNLHQHIMIRNLVTVYYLRRLWT